MNVGFFPPNNWPMATQRKKIDEFKRWQLERSEMYQYKGKANAHFIVDGIVFHNSVSRQSSHLLRNFEPVAEMPDVVDTRSVNPVSDLFRRIRTGIGKIFK